MASKGKRNHAVTSTGAGTGNGNGNDTGLADSNKRQRTSGDCYSKDPPVKQALLNKYYPNVLCLRDYLLSKLPVSSKVRRKKLLSVGRKASANIQYQDGDDGEDEDRVLGDFLDGTLIGVSSNNGLSQEDRLKEWVSFSQRGDVSVSNIADSNCTNVYSQSEIVDFAIWLLFSKSKSPNGRLQHLLCQGYRKDVSSRSVHRGENPRTSIPGVNSVYPNSHVTAMKAWPWPHVLSLLGKAGERVMSDLILDCGVFLQVKNTHGSYYQLSGQPLGEILPITNGKHHGKESGTESGSKKSQQPGVLHNPMEINFVRNRMLYAKPALNAQGEVQFGLRHIHIFNRSRSQANDGPMISRRGPEENIIRVLMYIFPLQFNLHNVFTSEVDNRETVQPFKDYTLREEEIDSKYPEAKGIKIPKRLRGKAKDLVRKLQLLHSRCSYNNLLEYYCPNRKHQGDKARGIQEEPSFNSTSFKSRSPPKCRSSAILSSSAPSIPARKLTLMDHASSTAEVSAFCRAVLRNIIPHGFWGTRDVQAHNESIFHKNVDNFIGLRRFEVLSLHEVMQGIKIAEIEWLRTPSTSNQKLSLTDFKKRREIFLEFLYYLFDSILIPLVRSHFHVTESNVHRQRLFFFRHDVWKSLAEPALASLKLKMFEEVKLKDAQQILASRTLGFSQMRLIPKETGVRPIMNLRRRAMRKGDGHLLGISINSVLTPVHNVLTHEKANNLTRLGSTLFSVGDLYQKVKSFKASLGGSTKPLYFAKVDVQAAFDTIPQAAVIKLMKTVPSEPEYRFSRHVEIKPTNAYNTDPNAPNKPIRRWKSNAKSMHHLDNFDEDLENDIAIGKKNTVFVENIVNQIRDTNSLLQLLVQHISQNMVKIGKKFYRQKEGIPQGSVLSSLLCNYFYADLEAKHLSFLQPDESLLLRLIDDFLLITLNPAHAKRFLKVMHDGIPEYGVGVNPDKTLTNFEVMINGKKIKRIVGGKMFPYCGNLIDMKTLNLSRDRDRGKELAMQDSLTVEYSRIPGKTFHRKVLKNWASRPLCHTQASDRWISSWVGDHQRIPTVIPSPSKPTQCT
ncbi:90dde13d-292a-4651-93b4-1c553ad6b48e [Sclerotinia trifoliorum]|uniref:Telomerase reverse transcriptase n=1 Tax=Sclerotinia trifoliorum TaxID=28548 RepID=A0A8H2W199_9HELO|nr:90dde13d-292a-4651-93b4-1c553ad6b48e [Sclerotinia trifoliorum]